jgi:predicted HTH domain antitoxin
MKALSIRELKNNPSAALREAQADGLVVVMNRQQPQALLVDLARVGGADLPGVKFALAVALFREGQVSLGYAARVAGLSVSALIERLERMGIPIVTVDDRSLDHDLSAVETWNRRSPSA